MRYFSSNISLRPKLFEHIFDKMYAMIEEGECEIEEYEE